MSGSSPILKDRDPSARLIGQADFERVRTATASELDRLANLLADRGLSPEDWQNSFAAALVDGHTNAAKVGRLWNLADGSTTAWDTALGRRRADAESDFLLGFLDDIENGRYTLDDGTLDLAKVQRRSDLYAKALRGTAYESWTENGDDGEEYEWILGATEQHCSTCPEMASLSPFQKDTLFIWPGHGTDCLGNCTCTLRRSSDGITGPRP